MPAFLKRITLGSINDLLGDTAQEKVALFGPFDFAQKFFAPHRLMFTTEVDYREMPFAYKKSVPQVNEFLERIDSFFAHYNLYAAHITLLDCPILVPRYHIRGTLYKEKPV